MVKSALSQNPDILYIDNLKDSKTAGLIFDASMRGKFIIASLPVQKISEIIPFLNYLGIEPFLISANVLGMISQTLIRTVSKKAISKTKISKEESSLILQEFKTTGAKIHQLEKDFRDKVHPKNKLSTSSNAILELPIIRKKENYELAFSGNTAIFEVLSLINGEISKEIKNLIQIKPTSVEIEEILSANNFRNMKLDGLAKVLQNETILPELMRKTGF